MGIKNPLKELNMKKFAMLGKWHVHAPEYANLINELPDCKVVKVWDEDEQTAKEWAAFLECEAASVEDILADPEIWGVVICTATRDHGPLMVKVCESGKALFTEKVLTLKTEDALKVKAAVEKNDTLFAISYPHLSEPHVQFALETAKSGKLGTVNYARLRNVHNGSIANWLPPHFYDGSACGGGAMIDLGAHPMYLLTDLMGLPHKVHSVFTFVTGRGVEDNAVSVLEYENGAIGVSETGFVSVDYPYFFEIGGDKGTVVVQGTDVKWCAECTDHQWLTPAVMPERKPLPIQMWAKADTIDDVPENIRIDAAVRLTRVMEMAYEK